MEYVAEFRRTFRSSALGKKLVHEYGLEFIFRNDGIEFKHEITNLAYQMFMESDHFTGLVKAKDYSNKRRMLFVKSAIDKYGNLYDYSNIKFDGEYVEIYCNKHQGIFRTERKYHISRGDCNVCRANASADAKVTALKMDFEYLWGNAYDYSNFTNYVDFRTKIEIICPHHGTFKLTPNEHKGARMVGCRQCEVDPKHMYSYNELRRDAIILRIQLETHKMKMKVTV